MAESDYARAKGHILKSVQALYRLKTLPFGDPKFGGDARKIGDQLDKASDVLAKKGLDGSHMEVESVKVDLAKVCKEFDHFISSKSEVSREDKVNCFLKTPIGKLAFEDFVKCKQHKHVTLTKQGQNRLVKTKEPVKSDPNPDQLAARRELNKEVNEFIEGGQSGYRNIDQYNILVTKIEETGGVKQKHLKKLSDMYYSSAAKTVDVKGLKMATVAMGFSDPSDEEENMVPCPKCSKKYYWRGALEAHISRHHHPRHGQVSVVSKLDRVGPVDNRPSTD